MMRPVGRMPCATTYALLAVCVFAFSTRVFAATTVTDAYDQPSSTTASAASNHSFTFTTPTGAAAGTTITLRFESGFVLTSIIEDDVDITDDSADLTTAAACGSAQVSVAAAGQTMTLTMCPGASIAATSVVNIEIGTNASSSGTGANRITNPSSAATYFVELAGTFGDSGSFPLPIVTDDNSGVSALVVSAGGGGGGGGGGAPAGPADGPGEEGPADGPGEEGPVDGPGEEGPADGPGEEGSIGVPGDGSGAGGPADGPGVEGPADGGGAATSSGGSDGGSGSAEGDGEDAGSGDNGSGSSGEGSLDVEVDVRIIVDGGISLDANDGTFDALGGTETTIVVVVDTDGTVDEVRVDIDGTQYVLTPVGDDTYTADVVLPRSDSAIDVEVDTEEGPTTYDTYYVDARGTGLVFERVNNSRVALPGSVVTVYEVVDGVRVPWGGTDNPFVVGEAGSFAFYVPNGTYVVTAGKSGYEDGTTGEITITDHILAPSIELVVAEELVEDEEGIAPSTPVAAAVARVTAAAAKVSGTVAAIVATPEVQTAVDVAKPATAVLAATSVVVLASSFNLLPFLQYLFTAPILFFARRKHKAFGVVYNAATKLPVDLAIVRMFALPNKRLIRSVVTDAKGKYLLTAAPGSYTLAVTKHGFVFPSELLKGRKDDGQYLDVYTGQQIDVTDKDGTIAANVPLDPEGQAAKQTPRAVSLRRFLRVLQKTIAALGIVLALVVLVISPSVFTTIMFVVQLVVYLLARRLAHPTKTKGWGIVYDAATRQPVGNAVVRLFEPTYNKLVETAVTDRLGRYAILVGPSEYYATYSKPGYTEKVVKPIDYRNKTEPSALALDVPMEEAKEDVCVRTERR